MRYSILNNICVSLVKWIEQVPPKRKPRHSPEGKNEKQLSVRIYSEKCYW